jgi:hypothetical protein
MPKNIVLCSDGTGNSTIKNRGTNVYKLYEAVDLETPPGEDQQVGFYDDGVGTGALKTLRALGGAFGYGFARNIRQLYAYLCRVYEPGDRIYLFGFSRGAYTVRCVGGVLKYCGVPTAVRAGGRVRPLQRDPKSARRIASEAVKHVYQYGGSIKGDPYRLEREKRAVKFRRKYFSGDAKVSNTAPYFIGVWETIQTLGAGTRGLLLLASAYEGLCAVLGLVWVKLMDGAFWPPFLLLGLALPIALYVAACLRYKGLVSLARYRHAFYDTKLNYAVRYARHALSIDEDRTSFACVPWDEEPPRQAFTDQRTAQMRFKQVWFAGNHSDIGGSYPETESRLSDIALAWMVEEAMGLPNPIYIDCSLLNLYPDCAGPQHDERKAFAAARPRWLVRCARLFVAAKDFGWRQGHRRVPPDALLHASVLERFRLPGVLVYGDMIPYRPHALRHHRLVEGYWRQSAAAPGAGPPPSQTHQIVRHDFEAGERRAKG